jgi:hypothetical protein
LILVSDVGRAESIESSPFTAKNLNGENTNLLWFDQNKVAERGTASLQIGDIR